MSEAYERAREGMARVGERRMQAYDGMMEQRTNRAAGNALQTGDYAGASNAFYQNGNVREGLAVQNAGRAAQTADLERTKTALVAGIAGLQELPEGPERLSAYQSRVVPFWRQAGVTDEQLAQIDPNTHLTDVFLSSLTAQFGGDVQAAPSGYRRAPGGRLAYIPGGPEDPANQRPIVTPYGIMLPPGSPIPNVAGQGAPQGQPQGEIVRQLPPGVVPFNQAPRAPAARGAERSQTPTVSFQSSAEAQSRVAQMVPGVNVTNADRTPADTARIRRQGYNPSDTSFHLRGQALDLTPPRGMTMGQLEAKMRQAGFRVLNEGHHIHVSW